MAEQTGIEIALPDAAATTALGARMAGQLNPGDAVLLFGDLGSGKTHLARAIIQARLAEAGAPPEDVPSPTYTLVQTYKAGDVEIWHTDLYRLSGPDEVLELGLDEAFETAVVLVEWPDRLERFRPPEAIRVTLAPTPEGGRRAVIEGWGDRGGIANV